MPYCDGVNFMTMLNIEDPERRSERTMQVKSILKRSSRHQASPKFFPFNWKLGVFLSWTRQPSSTPTPPPPSPGAGNEHDYIDDGCEEDESILFLLLQGILSVFSLVLVGFITFVLVQENVLQPPGSISSESSSDMVSASLICCMALFMGVLGYNQLCDLIATLQDRATAANYRKNESLIPIKHNQQKTIRFAEGTRFKRGQRPKRRTRRRRSSDLSEEEIRASARFELFLHIMEQKIIEASTKEVSRRKSARDSSKVIQEDDDQDVDSCCVDDQLTIEFEPNPNLPSRGGEDGNTCYQTVANYALDPHMHRDDTLSCNKLEFSNLKGAPAPGMTSDRDPTIVPCHSEFFNNANTILSEATNVFSRMAVCLLLGNEDNFVGDNDDAILLPSKGFSNTAPKLNEDVVCAF